MINNQPIYQTKLFGLNKFIKELINLYEINEFPNKILLSGQKGIGKSTMAYHLINYILSKGEKFVYDINTLSINPENHSFKTLINGSNPNITLVDIIPEKKFIDIHQIRKLIYNLNMSSFNQKPRFVLIDNLEFLNKNSTNALLKIIEEPNINVNFILINNNKKVLPTLLSRCINFKVYLSNKESLDITESLVNGNLYDFVNKDLINYYITPGNIINLLEFAKVNQFDLSKVELKEFLRIIIKNNYYKKDSSMKYMIFGFIETYFTKINFSFNRKINDKYSYFLNRIADLKKFNLDEESFFIEFEDKVLNG